MVEFGVAEIGIWVAIIIGFTTVSGIIYNVGKKTSNMESKARALDERQSRDIKNFDLKLMENLARIEKQHQNNVHALEAEIQRQTIERKDDMSNSRLSETTNTTNLQKQIDSAKTDIKTLLARIEVNETKIKGSDDIHVELKDQIKKHQTELLSIVHNQLDFITAWNQRIEDRIEALRVEFQRMMRHNENT